MVTLGNPKHGNFFTPEHIHNTLWCDSLRHLLVLQVWSNFNKLKTPDRTAVSLAPHGKATNTFHQYWWSIYIYLDQVKVIIIGTENSPGSLSNIWWQRFVEQDSYCI